MFRVPLRSQEIEGFVNRVGLVAYRVQSNGILVLEQSTCRNLPGGWLEKLRKVGEGPRDLPQYGGPRE